MVDARTYRGNRDLKVYQLSYAAAFEIYDLTKTFPREELYSLSDQIRRLSRSIPPNRAEAWKNGLRESFRQQIDRLQRGSGKSGSLARYVQRSEVQNASNCVLLAPLGSDSMFGVFANISFILC